MRKYLKETTLSAIADAIAETVVIRYNDNGSSRDERQTPTVQQRQVIRSVALGALLGLNWGEDNRSDRGREDAIINTAEFTLLCCWPKKDGECVNGYDSIYNPLRAVVEVWRLASEGTRNGSRSLSVWHMFPEWLDFLNAILAYPDRPEDWTPYASPDEAAVTLDAWKECGIVDDMPAQDAGLLFLLWNLYVSDYAPEKGVI